MSDPSAGADEWVLSHGHSKVEVTAFNPANGRSKKLESGELKEVLGLLVAYERAKLHGAASDIHTLSRHLDESGLNHRWYDRPAEGKHPLFTASAPGLERSGRTLKDLLDAVRAAGPAPAGNPKEKLIFVIDDDDDLRELFHFVIRKDGFQVDIFPDAVDGIQAVHNMLPDRSPDLLILDLMLPKKAGFEALRELQTGDTSRIPILVITGRNVDAKMKDVLTHEPNVVGFLPKPVSAETLLKTLHRLLGTRPAAKPAPGR